METKQAPHEKLTDEEIKELVSDLTVEVYEIKQHFLEQLEVIESYVYKLKKHFCPEKFQIMSVSIKEMSDMMEYSYDKIDLASPARRMTRQTEGNDGVAKTE